MPGRPPKPTALHVLEGTYRADRHARRVEFAGELPAMPAWLHGPAAELWDIICASFPAGGLTEADSASLTMLCHSFARWRELSEQLATGDGDAYKLTVMQSVFAKQFVSLASRFGLTPADRAKLALPRIEGDDGREGRNYAC